MQVLAALTLIGKMIPAVGLAMLMQVIFKKSIIPFFVIGFLAAAYLSMGITFIAILGGALAYLHFIYSKKGGVNHV